MSKNSWTLAYDEHILWSGKPKQGFIFTRQDPFHILIGIGFFVIPVIIILSNFYHNKISFLLLLIALVCCIIGVCLIGFSRIFFDINTRKNIEYIVTNQRILTTFKQIIVKERPFLSLSSELIELPDSTGTIAFNFEISHYRLTNFKYGHNEKAALTSRFWSIQNARQVYDLIILSIQTARKSL
jgi:hypothetical protein